jgi:hypothetical protein
VERAGVGVLARTTAEEGVLTACKGVMSGGGSADDQSGCMLTCVICSDIAQS